MNRWTTALTVAVALSVAGWYVYGKGAASRDAEVAELKLANSNILLGYATAAQQAEQVIRETQTAKTVAVAAADARARKEVQNANKKLEAARAALHTGAVGVRLNGADCAAAAGSGGLPAAAGAAGMADGAGGGLPQGVSERVLDLQHALESDAAKIGGLQEYVREVCR